MEVKKIGAKIFRVVYYHYKNTCKTSKREIKGEELRKKKKDLPTEGGRVVQLCWINFQCRGVLLICIRVGQGLTAFAVDAGGGCLDIFFLSVNSFFFPSLWETAPI